MQIAGPDAAPAGLGISLLDNSIGRGMAELAQRLRLVIPFIEPAAIREILDIGSGDGYDSLNLARVFHNAQVHGFEPIPNRYQRCQRMRSAANKMLGSRLNFHCLAAGNREATVAFFQPTIDAADDPLDGASMLVSERPSEQIYTECITLDTWCSLRGVRPQLLRLVAGGSELEALQGADSVLDHVSVILTVVAVAPYYQGQALKSSIDEYLISRGFVELESAMHMRNQYQAEVIYLRGSAGHTGQEQMSTRTLSGIIDALNLDTNKEKLYGFCDGFYERELAAYRDRPISLLEVGIWSGDSLRLWGEYFSQARIMGIDVYLMPQVGPMVAKYNSISVVIADAYTTDKVSTLSEFDVIIDDGSHNLANQLFMVENYLPKVKPGGLFVIEVVQTREHLDHLMAVVPADLQPYAEAVDLSSIKNKPDALLLVVRVPESYVKQPTPVTVERSTARPATAPARDSAAPSSAPQGPRSDYSSLRYALVTIHDDNYKELADITWHQNKLEYARLHKYDVIAMTDNFDSSIPIGFEKIRLLRSIMAKNQHDVLFWSGTDSLITNFCIPLSDYVYPQHHVVISNDFNGINADSFVIRNTMEGRAWLDMIMGMVDQYRNHPYVEQGVMMDTQEQMQHVVKVLPQRYLNSYYLPLYHQKGAKDDLDSLGYGGNWRVGDFLLHAPDMPLDIRIALFNQVLPRVIKG